MSSLKVLLIDADMDHGGLSKKFTADEAPGLVDLVDDESLAFQQVVREIGPGNLCLLPRGTNARPGDLYRFEAVERVINEAASQFDLIFVDGADANSIARFADHLIWVVESEKTRREVVVAGLAKMDGVGDKTLGVILNKRKFYIPHWLYSRL